MSRFASLLFLLALAAFFSCGCEQIIGSQANIASTLKSFENIKSSFVAPGCGSVEIGRIRFDRILVKPDGARFLAVTTVDAEALFKSRVQISYLGLERIVFERGRGKWALKGALLPALQETIALLCDRMAALKQKDFSRLDSLLAKDWTDSRFDRRQALKQARDRMDAQPPGVVYRVTRWIVRTEREEAEILEEFEERQGDAAVRHGQVRFRLRREDGKLRFVSGLI